MPLGRCKKHCQDPSCKDDSGQRTQLGIASNGCTRCGKEQLPAASKPLTDAGVEVSPVKLILEEPWVRIRAASPGARRVRHRTGVTAGAAGTQVHRQPDAGGLGEVALQALASVPHRRSSSSSGDPDNAFASPASSEPAPVVISPVRLSTAAAGTDDHLPTYKFHVEGSCTQCVLVGSNARGASCYAVPGYSIEKGELAVAVSSHAETCKRLLPSASPGRTTSAVLSSQGNLRT